MNKHTPGPWKCLTNGDHYVVMREGQGSRGVLLIEALTKPKAMADAMLIAAAPDLLEALQTMLDVWPNTEKKPGWCKRWDDAQEQARAAIAKANGAKQ